MTKLLKTHLAVSRSNMAGGRITATLCGRENAPDASSEAIADVDCKRCQHILAQPGHWQYLRYETSIRDAIEAGLNVTSDKVVP